MLLSKLPGELRNQIIRLAVVEDSDIKPSVSRPSYDLNDQSTAKLKIEHPLMQTCKQLRLESAEIYFLENTFHLTHGDFFTLRSCDQQHRANERAILALAHAFRPWASKVRRLRVSHAICYDLAMFGNAQQRWRRAEVHVDVCRRAQGQPGVYLETVRAHDVDTLSHAMCRCGVIQHAADKPAADVFEYAQGLVGMMDLVPGQRYLPHCWGCGLEPMS